MEDVGSIGMNVDRVFVEVIEAISADVIFSIDNDNLVDVSNEASPKVRFVIPVPTNKIFMTTPFEIN